MTHYYHPMIRRGYMPTLLNYSFITIVILLRISGLYR